MTTAYVDADVIIRLLSGDDPKKQQAAAAMFQRVEDGALELTTPVTTLADCLYVLCSPRLYAFTRIEAAARLTALVQLPNFKLQNKHTLIRALELFAAANIDFGDAMIAAAMVQDGAKIVYSYDADFDRLPGIARKSP